MLEDGPAALDREYLHGLAAKQQKLLDQLDAALVRIKNGTYGICRVTGNLIQKERLLAVPHTTLSIQAKQNLQAA
ncbi:TraR/DksA C4-type zinc finger protein [Mucilaginibacter sp. CAU 1740]|uniref:TraR/DksA family transcriptional regulator n=1 Tax=Mucilaginibacter sp. CAU 1740 TaxID=3140365 RepID=UPI00325B6D71